MENLNYKNKNIERKLFKIMQKNQFLELEKYFIELKDREVKIKREIELFFKPIIV